MKWFLLLMGMIGGITATRGQQLNFGAEAGLSASSMAIRHQGQVVKTSMAPGFKAGALADIRFNDMFSIQPGLYYNQKGYVQNDHKSILPYAELPVNFQFRFPVGADHFFAGGGPYAAYLLSDNEKIAYETGATSDTDLKPFDLGININGGYLWRGSIFLRANAGFGFMNLDPNGNSDNALRNCSLGLTLGYILVQ